MDVDFTEEASQMHPRRRSGKGRRGGRNLFVCSECLRWYRLSVQGIYQRRMFDTGRAAEWGKGRWPGWIYHPNDDSDCCAEHHLTTTTKRGKAGRFPRGRSKAIAIRRSDYQLTFRRP